MRQHAMQELSNRHKPEQQFHKEDCNDTVYNSGSMPCVHAEHYLLKFRSSNRQSLYRSFMPFALRYGYLRTLPLQSPSQ